MTKLNYVDIEALQRIASGKPPTASAWFAYTLSRLIALELVVSGPEYLSLSQKGKNLLNRKGLRPGRGAESSVTSRQTH